MAISISEVIKQNTAGQSDGAPVGVPASWGWYGGLYLPGYSAPPSNFTAVTGWAHIYQEAGAPAYSNANSSVEIANSRTYVHLRATGEWVLAQNPATSGIAGAQFVTDFNGPTRSMRIGAGSGGSTAISTPDAGYMDHFWPTARGTFAAGSVDGVYVQMDMRVTDPNLNLIAQVGADWWRDANAGFNPDFSNNPAAGTNNWTALTTEWKTMGFYSTSAGQFQADPPPLLGSGQTTPPVISPPVTSPPVTSPPVTSPPVTSPPVTSPPVTSPPATGANLLVNGSFEASTVAAGHWAGFSSIPGWTALTGGTIELWNSLNAGLHGQPDNVKATNGSNFGELDFMGARDGFYQTVKTNAGQSYELSFDARSRPDWAGLNSSIEVLWNDQAVATVPPGSNWETHRFSVTGTGGQDRLTFREPSQGASDGHGALYDNVSLVAAGSGGTSAVQQSAVSQQPAVVTQSNGVGQRPGVGSQQPALVSQPTGVGQRPGLGNQQPALVSQQPSGVGQRSMDLLNQYAATSSGDRGAGLPGLVRQTDLSTSLAQTLGARSH